MGSLDETVKQEVRLDDEKEGSSDLKGENVVRRYSSLNLGEPDAWLGERQSSSQNGSRDAGTARERVTRAL
jgi:hypothetical protein